MEPPAIHVLLELLVLMVLQAHLHHLQAQVVLALPQELQVQTVLQALQLQVLVLQAPLEHQVLQELMA